MVELINSILSIYKHLIKNKCHFVAPSSSRLDFGKLHIYFDRLEKSQKPYRCEVFRTDSCTNQCQWSVSVSVDWFG